MKTHKGPFMSKAEVGDLDRYNNLFRLDKRIERLENYDDGKNNKLLKYLE